MATQITRARLVFVLSAVLGTAACAKEAPAPATPGGGDPDVCAIEAQAATSSVLDVVAAHRACITNGDCVVVDVNASCFDACTRAVSQDGVDAVQAARTATETGPCVIFAAKGCTLITPPCAPPAEPTCVAGSCQ